MEQKKKEFVINPQTNRLIEKGKPKHNRLVKLGVIKEADTYKGPALVVEKKVKAVANVEDLSKSELDDIYSQIKLLRDKRDAIIDRRLRGRPEGVKGDPAKPKIKEDLKKSGAFKSKFNISVQPSKTSTDTEYDLNEDADD